MSYMNRPRRPYPDNYGERLAEAAGAGVPCRVRKLHVGRSLPLRVLVEKPKKP